MKPPKRTMALAALATSTFVNVPQAFALGESSTVSASSNIDIVFPLTAAGACVVAIGACIGFGIKSRQLKRLEIEFYNYKMDYGFKSIKELGASEPKDSIPHYAIVNNRERDVASDGARKVVSASADATRSGAVRVEPSKNVRESASALGSALASESAAALKSAPASYNPKHAKVMTDSSIPVVSNEKRAATYVPRHAAQSTGVSRSTSAKYSIDPSHFASKQNQAIQSPAATGEFLATLENNFSDILGLSYSYTSTAGLHDVIELQYPANTSTQVSYGSNRSKAVNIRFSEKYSFGKAAILAAIPLI